MMQLKIVLVSRLVSKDLEIQMGWIFSLVLNHMQENWWIFFNLWYHADTILQKKLISHDQNSNTYNYKYVFSVEVVPICKDNVVCLPVRLARSLGSIGQICHVQKVNHLLHLIDPNTCQ